MEFLENVVRPWPASLTRSDDPEKFCILCVCVRACVLQHGLLSHLVGVFFKVKKLAQSIDNEVGRVTSDLTAWRQDGLFRDPSCSMVHVVINFAFLLLKDPIEATKWKS